MNPYFAPPRATWIWLLDHLPEGDALAVGSQPEALASELRPHARTVVLAERAPFPCRDASVACLALDDPLSALAARSGMPAVALLQECRRVLRPGGCLAVADENPWWVKRIGHRGAAGPSRHLATIVARAGFRHARHFYLTPSVEQPQTIIPATRAAALAYESCFGADGFAGAVRLVLSGFGGHRLLYPGELVLAEAA